MAISIRRSMDPDRWIGPGTERVLDVGCNVGALLKTLRERNPTATLAGCDVNPAAIQVAQKGLPDCDLRVCSGAELPWSDEVFDCITCIETLEHMPPNDWEKALREMRRVLQTDGRLILRVPHAGLFAWLDSNNIRFRFPSAYRALLGGGRRDSGYQDGAAGVLWHHHFTQQELLTVAGAGWDLEAQWYGGLVLFPVCDYLLWPFYRFNWQGGMIRRAIERVMHVDYEINYGKWSYGILVVLRKRT